MLEGTAFETVKELSDWQKGEVAKHAQNGVVYTAPKATLIKLDKHTEVSVCEGAVSMNREELVCGEIRIPVDKISDLAMHGQKALVFSVQDTYYEMTPSDEANSLKFMLLYRAYKNNGGEKTPVMR